MVLLLLLRGAGLFGVAFVVEVIVCLGSTGTLLGWLRIGRDGAIVIVTQHRMDQGRGFHRRQCTRSTVKKIEETL